MTLPDHKDNSLDLFLRPRFVFILDLPPSVLPKRRFFNLLDIANHFKIYCPSLYKNKNTSPRKKLLQDSGVDISYICHSQ